MQKSSQKSSQKSPLKTLIFGAGLIFVSSFLVSINPASATDVLTLTISSNDLSLNLAPTSVDGAFATSDDLTISVTLNVTGGYTLGIRGDSASSNPTALVNTADSSKFFSSIPSAITESTFSSSSTYNNKWGYKPSKYNSSLNTNYQPAPNATAGDTLDIVSSFKGTNEYTLSFGARANSETAIGSYTGTFIIAAVPTIACNTNATTINDAICMQDMNDSVANSMVEGVQYQLLDIRDNKIYYIAKMKDGRVWMTQNLDLDLRNDTDSADFIALTSENTDLNTYGSNNYDSSNGYSCSNTSSTDCAGAGEIIIWTPIVPTSSDVNDFEPLYSTPQSYDPGETYHYPDQSSFVSFTEYESETACTNAHPNGTCDHYHIGNYYNWPASIASNNASNFSTSYTTADNSICPAGWRLPMGKTSTSASSVNYHSEINYTLVSESIVKSLASNGASSYTDNGQSIIRFSPMYIALSGYIKDNNTVLSLSTAFYRTNTVYNVNNVFIASIFVSGIQPSTPSSTTSTKSTGISIRCVARQSNTGSTTITFNANASSTETGTYTGNTGDSNNQQTFGANTLNNLSSNGFAISGYVFNSWNTEPDGSGTSYTDEERFYAKVGTETTNVTLYAIWDKLYTITFHTSNATSIYFDRVTYTNGQTTTAISGKSYIISGNYPTGYSFSNWSVTAGTLANSNAPATTYTVSGDATITLSEQEATTDMTTVSASGIIPNNCATNTPIRNLQLVYDIRDHEAYWVAELCDGKVWMLDNLRLNLSNETILHSLSSTNTNASDQALSCLKTGQYNGVACTAPYAIPSTTSQSSDVLNYISPRINTDYKNDIPTTVFGYGSNKVGIYYNYCAASAGSYCYPNNSGVDIANTYRDIESDLCPIGWHLPTGNNNNDDTRITEYGTLYDSYFGAANGQAETLKMAFSAAYSGHYFNSQSGFSSSGRFWSSTYYSVNNIYNLGVSARGLFPTDSGDRRNEESIRCVLDS